MPNDVACLACRFLRTKRMYINLDTQLDSPFAVESRLNDESFYWCNLTLTDLGSDGEQVHPRLCLGNRQCYEAV